MYMQDDNQLYSDAEKLWQDFQRIRNIQRRLVRRQIHPDMHGISLTGPQEHLQEVLLQHEGGLTLKELSQKMGLAHSTVSGIVDRLERLGMVQRMVEPKDRRYIRIDVTDAVKQYVQRDLQSYILSPFASTLQKASEGEKRLILEGVSTLRRLMENALQQAEEQDS
jgi:MarR family transcriptional regulator, organic hydroperoxide resistance regulator